MPETKHPIPVTRQSRFQFGIRAILLITFAAAFMAAVFSQAGAFFSSILLTVLLANFIGVVVALTVTFVFGFPRDGSLRRKEQPAADEEARANLGDENGIAG